MQIKPFIKVNILLLLIFNLVNVSCYNNNINQNPIPSDYPEITDEIKTHVKFNKVVDNSEEIIELIDSEGYDYNDIDPDNFEYIIKTEQKDFSIQIKDNSIGIYGSEYIILQYDIGADKCVHTEYLADKFDLEATFEIIGNKYGYIWGKFYIQGINATMDYEITLKDGIFSSIMKHSDK